MCWSMCCVLLCWRLDTACLTFTDVTAAYRGLCSSSRPACHFMGMCCDLGR